MSQLVLKHPDLKHEDLKFNTVEVHAGEPQDMYGALIPPIYQTSTFYFDSTDDAVKACDDYAESFAYSRITNPSVDYLEQKLAALEHGKGAVAYASGMGAVSGAIFALLKSGDHAIFTKAKYSGTEDVTSDWLPRFGIAHDTFAAADLSQLEGLIKPNTKLIYVESPANPTMVLVDIAAVVEIAHKHGIKVFIDNTFATPYNTTPLDLGVDAVIHSLTKYIGGHGDLLGTRRVIYCPHGGEDPVFTQERNALLCAQAVIKIDDLHAAASIEGNGGANLLFCKRNTSLALRIKRRHGTFNIPKRAAPDRGILYSFKGDGAGKNQLFVHTAGLRQC